MAKEIAASASDDIFASADWYDRSINWDARLGRELPVLVEIFGPPGKGGLVDAGCGTGRHAIALAKRGYRTIGVDSSEEMLIVARRLCEVGASQNPPSFVHARYDQMFDKVGGGHDGVFCLGNALAASGTRDAVLQAVASFSQCLREGGRMFLQVLNFAVMRQEDPCVRGPRVAVVDGCEYVSFRHFHFAGDQVQVSNVTLWRDGTWRKHVRSRRLFPVVLSDLSAACESADLRIDAVWGSYARDPFDVGQSVDLILVATRLPQSA
ncbi:MAG: class I SAM-dependent methyltransferase [Planctomycetes bacterium]|nr:class I SAM-dependent methyltransferase [Planctomycetota bacterium]